MLSSQDSISISQSMPWLSSNKSNITNKSLSNRTTGNIIYPIFTKYLDYVDDPYWKQILEGAAKGKFPKGISINGNIIFHKTNNKSITMEDNPYFCGQFMDFIKSNLKLRSKMDLDNERDVERKKYMNFDNTITDWSKIKSKYNKQLFIVEFVSKLEILYGLSDYEKNQLRTLINFYGDNIGKNILIKDNNISEIKGLLWNPETRIFTLNNIQKKENNNSSQNINVKYVENNIPIELSSGDIIKEWNKFLKNFNKSLKKNLIKDESISLDNKLYTSPLNTNDSYGSESSNS